MAGRLSSAAIIFIVKANACFWQPSEVVKGVQEEFEVAVSRSHVQHYDPTKGDPAKLDLNKKWVKLFNETREKFLKDESSHAISYEGYRLGQLQLMYEQARKSGNRVLAASLLEQAAKERGGMFTNRRQLKIEDPLGELAKILGTNRDEVESQISGKGISDDVPQIG